MDLITANVGAAQYIIGNEASVDAVDLNYLSIKIYQERELLGEVSGSNAKGDQWAALLWLVNQVVSQGHQLMPGQILITGSLGKLLPGKPGKYIADYGELGQIQFEIR